jgi:hypothetical protein
VVDGVRTGGALLFAQAHPQRFHSFFEVIFLFFHVLDQLVAFREQGLKAADFYEKTTANLKGKF